MALRREKAGVFVSEWRNFTAHMDWAWDAGFRWLAVKGHSGQAAPDTGHPSAEFLARARGKGFDVGCWGAFGEGDPPVACAQAANGVIEAYDYTFYIANIECLFPDKTFLTHFRHLKPKFTVWLSSEISNPRDWDAWFKKGDVVPGYPVATAWLPQCYTNVNPNATPKNAHFWAVRPQPPGYGIPADAVKPTIGVYDPRQPIDVYISQLKDTALGPGGAKLGPGFSVYLGETAHQTEYVKLGTAIRRDQIALL